MRYLITFEGIPDNISNTDMASWIYAVLDKVSPEYAAMLHDKGYPVPDRPAKFVKPFVFSMLYPTRKGYALKVSSLDGRFNYIFTQGLNNPPDLKGMKVTGINYRPPLVPERTKSGDFRAICFTLSPVIIRTHDGYMPLDIENKIVNDSLRISIRDRFHAVMGRPVDDDYIKVYTRDTTNVKVNVKSHNFYGTVGRIILYGSGDMLVSALNLGLGAKNALGFGLLEKHDFRVKR
ncbi:MAG: CRISPR-associated endoribonuclease Cas6 [Thermoproteota archaeon]